MIGTFGVLEESLSLKAQPLIPSGGGEGGPKRYLTFPMCFLQMAENRTSQGLGVSRSPKEEPQEEAHWKSEQQRCGVWVR